MLEILFGKKPPSDSVFFGKKFVIFYRPDSNNNQWQFFFDTHYIEI